RFLNDATSELKTNKDTSRSRKLDNFPETSDGGSLTKNPQTKVPRMKLP
ncbi:19989_t:CDS:1, partial [Racocetra persica]